MSVALFFLSTHHEYFIKRTIVAKQTKGIEQCIFSVAFWYTSACLSIVGQPCWKLTLTWFWFLKFRTLLFCEYSVNIILGWSHFSVLVMLSGCFPAAGISGLVWDEGKMNGAKDRDIYPFIQSTPALRLDGSLTSPWNLKQLERTSREEWHDISETTWPNLWHRTHKARKSWFNKYWVKSITPYVSVIHVYFYFGLEWRLEKIN